MFRHEIRRSLGQVYRAQRAEQVSWFQPRLEVSIELLLSAGLNASSRMIDIGGDVSTLVDDLLDRDVRSVAVLDISAAALQDAPGSARRSHGARPLARE